MSDRRQVKQPLLIYRGPFQSRRLSLVVEAMFRAWGPVSLCWILPDPDLLTRKSRSVIPSFIDETGDQLEKLIAYGAEQRPANVLHGDSSEVRLSQLLRASSERPRVVFGLSTAHHTPSHYLASDALVLASVPEERLMKNNNWRTQAKISAIWRVARIANSQGILVGESSRHVEYSAEKMKFQGPRHVLANVADIGRFAPPQSEMDRRYFCYLGSGSAWQGIDYLAEVWSEYSRLDRAQEFLVISNDPRTEMLVDAVPRSRVRRLGVPPDEVPRLLWLCRMGFLLRPKSVVNSMVIPLKLAEYLSAGVPVATSRNGWDAEQIVGNHDAGPLIEAELQPKLAAVLIRDWLRDHDTDQVAEACVRASGDSFSRARQVEAFANVLNAK
jgi:glycosyltransferase involved in cell wall biosynthesis